LGKEVPFHHIYIKEENNMSAESQLITCLICNKQFKSITNRHLEKKHNLTTVEYKALFPSAIFISNQHKNKFKEWANSDMNLQHIKLLQKENANSEYRKERFRQVAKTQSYKDKMRDTMKEKVKQLPDSIMWRSIKGKDHIHYQKSNHQRWSEKYGKEEADIRLLAWKKANKLFSRSKDTSIELLVKEYLNTKNIIFIQQYDVVDKLYADFYLPEYNLIFECYGDYWHANPRTYNPDDIIKYPGQYIVAKDRWASDINRMNIFKSYGYNTSYLFEYDIKNNISLLDDILHGLGKI
jgi:G:T-mismatch repair DNA endonuclease (very short patch repair protein)